MLSYPIHCASWGNDDQWKPLEYWDDLPRPPQRSATFTYYLMRRVSGRLRPIELFDNADQFVTMLAEGPRNLFVAEHSSAWETAGNQSVSSQSAWQILRHADFEDEYYLIGNTIVPSNPLGNADSCDGLYRRSEEY